MFVTLRGNKGNTIRMKSKAYEAWVKECDDLLAIQKPKPLTPPVALTVTIYGGKGFMVSGDVSNRIKAAEDAMVRAGIVPDDDVRNVVRVTAQYYPPQGKKDVARAVLLVQEVRADVTGESRP
jgi:Holliday junction resolvase RusA-like endonuclease